MPREQTTLKEKVNYYVDNQVVRRPLAKLLLLFAISMVLMLMGGLAYWGLVATQGNGLLSAMWSSWTFLADPGTHVAETDPMGRTVAVAVTIAGMLFFALLVGLVTDSIRNRVEELRRGRSRVLESGHSLILGWSDRVVPLIQQLALANESQGGGVVVVLAERDKVEMDDEIKEEVGELRGTQVVCRSGSPALVPDLDKVSASHARSVIVLAESSDADVSDAQAIRTVLALRRGLGDMRGHVVVEVSDIDNREVIQLIGKDAVEVIVGHDLTGRLMVQCARQPGLAQVYHTLLDFEGEEFYLAAWPQLTGQTFAEVCRSFRTAVVCGIKPQGQRVLVNPASDKVIEEGDLILVVAEDDNTYRPSAPVSESPPQANREWSPPVSEPERLLFCGWRRDILDMIGQLDEYVAPGSELTVLAGLSVPERLDALRESELAPHANLKIKHQVGNPESRRDLEAAGVGEFGSILVLADETWSGPANQVDSRALVSLLLIRDIEGRVGNGRATLISEICDPRTKRLVTIADVSDYVVSNEIISMSLAQVSEHQDIADVWEELFDPDGNEVYLKDPRRYCDEGETLSFWELSDRGRRRGEVVLGFKRADKLQPVINPADKSKPMTLTAGDQVVVVALEQG